MKKEKDPTKKKVYREKFPDNSILELDTKSPFMGPHRFLYYSRSNDHDKQQITQLDYPTIKAMQEPLKSRLLRAANRIISRAYLP